MKFCQLIAKSVFLLLILPLLFLSCADKKPQNHVNRSIYYWKSVFKLSGFEKERLARLKINTIYLKLFDVDWNDVTNAPSPVAQIRITDGEYLRRKNIIPAIFITNECIFKITPAQTDSLANKIFRLVKNIAEINFFSPIKEIQIDCDWTASTKDRYFSILKTLRQLDPSMLFSATIRLHQVKFMGKTGIPPVDKGLLMCYNMGNLKDPSTNNSILEAAELKKYIAGLGKYPLPLDIGLPIFEWDVLLRNGNYIGLLQNFSEGMPDAKKFKKNGNRYEVLMDTIISGYTLMKGDVIRNEQSNYGELLQTVEIVKKKFPPQSTSFNVSLYHLDSLTLSKYSLYEMENIYDGMR